MFTFVVLWLGPTDGADDDYIDSRDSWIKETCHDLGFDLRSILTLVKPETLLGGDPRWHSNNKVSF